MLRRISLRSPSIVGAMACPRPGVGSIQYMHIGLLGTDRFRHCYQFIVHVDSIDTLIEKAQELGNRRTCGQRFAVAPHDVLEDPLANPGGPIRCLALVRTTSGGLSRLQELRTDILL